MGRKEASMPTAAAPKHTAPVSVAAPASPVPGPGAGLSLEEAVPMFLEYLRTYRSCSPLSIASYRADLR